MQNVVQMITSHYKFSLGGAGCESKCNKVLGQVWDNEVDQLKFEIPKVEEKAKTLPTTKRNLLSVLASLFDPLALLCPVVVGAKSLF